ncbi:polyketide synthase [Lysinibacillus sphaericus]|nr:condensation domain-containing protein [Lysinibacillus sphaericus]KEK12558.1 polyketide synthase [Lysinibacillus sphaericus]
MSKLIPQVLNLLKNKELTKDAAKQIIESVNEIKSESKPKVDKKIAIIGISAELPGAKNFDEFWNVLSNEQDKITELSDSRRSLCEGFLTNNMEKLKISKEKPFWDAAWLDEVDKFDAGFFNISAAEAKVMDPQQRRFLQIAYQCFEDAGYAGSRIKNSNTGVYISAAMTNYSEGLAEFTPLSVPGNIPAFTASRISYIFNLKGPSYVVNATCASSMLAIHEACVGLMNNDCETALVGGVNIFPYPINSEKLFMNAAGIMSEQQKCKPFDDSASGIGRGEGAVALLLKPLDQAIEDNDNIHAVIIASKVNNDGTSAGITAPNPKAHADLLAETWDLAGIKPEQIDYIEAHGTGTHLGDPIEIKGIQEAVERSNNDKQFLPIGSVKGNIGHLLDGAAGLSGVIKALHVIKKGVVPPTINLVEPNTHIDFVNSPVFIPTVPFNIKENKKENEPIIAGVSCFGFNGTNVHLLLEGAPTKAEIHNKDHKRKAYVIPFSAKSELSLRGTIEHFSNLSGDMINLSNLAYTMCTGREHHEIRLAIIAETMDDLIGACKSLVNLDMTNWEKIIDMTTDDDTTIKKLAENFITGEKCSWHKQFQDENNHKISLPTYYFDEKSYWLQSDASVKAIEVKGKTALEEIISLAEIILETENIKQTDSFISVGGNSLSGLQFITRLKKQFNRDFVLDDVFLTFEQLSKQVNNDHSESTEVIPQISVENHEFPLSYGQNRLSIIEQLTDQKMVYNTPFIFKVNGLVDIERLRQTFDVLSQRHESLRTVFVKNEDGNKQKILQKPNYLFEYKDFSIEDNAEAKAMDQLNRWKETPYDLEAGPLLRVFVYKTEKNKSLFALMMHHIIVDGWSLSLLSDELFTLYNSSNNEALPEIENTYVDFAAWQRENIEGGRFKQHEDYWLDTLRGSLPITEITGDKLRPSTFRYTGRLKRFDISASLADKLRAFANTNESTLYMVLVSSVFKLINQMTGDTDMVIGTPVSGRVNEELEKIIGLFTNTIPLRVNYEEYDNFLTLLRNVKTMLLDSFKHQEYPFDLLVEKLDLPRDTSRSPLFNINVALQNFKFKNTTSAFDEAELTPILSEHKTSKWDLEFEFVELPNGELFCNLEYYDGVYSSRFIDSLIETYLKILDMILHEHELTNIDVEKSKSAINGPFVEDGKNFLTTILMMAEKNPQKTALEDSAGSLTYQELVDRSKSIAEKLLNSNSEIKNAVIISDNNRTAILGILSCLMSNVTFIPVSPKNPRARIESIIKQSQANFIISEKKFYSLCNRLLFENKNIQTVMMLGETDLDQCAVVDSSDLMNESLWNYFAEGQKTEIEASGWNSSYTGEAFSALEMQEYAENAVNKIRKYLPQDSNVLELGCGSGLTTFALAPYTKTYTAMDLSSSIIERNKQIAQKSNFSNIKFDISKAHAFKKFETALDAVVINSVIHCFPSYGYLKVVLQKAIDSLKEGGIIFLGDLLNIDKKDEFVSSLQAFKEENMDKNTKLDWDTDLFINEEILKELLSDVGADIQIECSEKTYTVSNELNQYRFDAVIIVKDKGEKYKRSSSKNMLSEGIHLDEHVEIELNYFAKTSPAYILFTSGSTGKPKGVVVSGKNLNNYLNWATAYYSPTGKSLDMPFFTSISVDLTITSMFIPLITGGKIMCCEGEIDQAFESVAKIKETITIKGTPKQIQYLIEDERFAPNVECFILGGEALDITLCKTLRDQFPHARIINEYGPTEATVGTIYHEVTEEDLHSDYIHAPIGLPIHNTSVYILNNQNQLVPSYGVGEIVLSGESVALGYLGEPNLTRNKFIANHINHLQSGYLYKTGDLGQVLPNGKIVCYGRKDNMVKIRGHRVELEEIERYLREIPSIKDAVVKLYKNEDGEQLCAYLVSQQEINQRDIEKHLLRYLPESLIPTYYQKIEQIPMSNSGKVDRLSLPSPELYDDRIVQTDDISSLTEIERELLSILKGILSDRQFNIDSDFFKIGGDSIKALKFISKAKEKNINLKIDHIFNCRSIRKIAMNTTKEMDIQKEWQELSSKEIPLAPMQRWFFQQTFKHAHYWNLLMSVELPEKVDVAALEKSFQSIISVNESLLTWFDVNESKPKAFVEPSLVNTFKLIVKDLKLTPPSRLKEEIENIQFQLQNNFNFGKVLPIGAVVFLTSKKPILTFFIHHLVVDGVSWRVLLEELENNYLAIVNGEDKISFPMTQFSDWIGELYKKELHTNHSYWENIDVENVHPLCIQPVRKDYLFKDRYHVTKTLSEESTKQFLNARKHSEIYKPDVLIAVTFAQAFSQIFGQQDVLFNFEGHGRDSRKSALDLSRTIGWFTTMYPLQVTINTLEEMLYTVGQSLSEIGSGLDFMIARWIKENNNITHIQPSILVNYLGDFDNDISTSANSKNGGNGVLQYSSNLPQAPAIHPDNELSNILEINIFILDGKLNLSLEVDTQVISNEQAQLLLSKFEEALVECSGNAKEPQNT